MNACKDWVLVGRKKYIFFQYPAWSIKQKFAASVVRWFTGYMLLL